MHPVRCTCGNSFMAPPGAAGVVCPYCRQPLGVHAAVPGPASEARRTWAAVLLAGAIVALLVGAMTRSWLTASERDEEVHVGLLGAEECDEGECEQIDFDDAGRHDKMVKLLGLVGKIALAGTLALCGMLAWTGTRVLARRPAFGPGIATIVLAALGVVGATMWAMQIKTALHGALSYGYSYLLYVAGAVAGLIGAVLARGPSRD